MIRRLILALTLEAALAMTWIPYVQADGTPVRIVLNYLTSVSNWGPTNAGGILDLIRAEGEARATVRGLPQAPGQHYVLWLVHQGGNEVFRVGELQFQPDGTASLDLMFPNPIPDHHWNLALVTVETTTTPARPGPRHSIAGYFPQIVQIGAPPPTLPNTGLGGAAIAEGGFPFSNDLWLLPLGTAGLLAWKRYRRRM